MVPESGRAKLLAELPSHAVRHSTDVRDAKTRVQGLPRRRPELKRAPDTAGPLLRAGGPSSVVPGSAIVTKVPRYCDLEARGRPIAAPVPHIRRIPTAEARLKPMGHASME